jgi:gliding motility-associated transport system permease protein
MRHVPTLLKRELSTYFLSPMAYMILLGFQAVAWMNFWQLVVLISMPQRWFAGSSNPMLTYIAGSPPFWIAVLVAVPALTMRLIAEERRSGTIETLLTVPVTETEVAVSKWLAAVVMYLMLLVPFAFYLPFLYTIGKFHFDTGPMASLAIGLTTMGMMFSAIGLFFSSLTRNQIVAAICTFVVLFMIVVLTGLAYHDAELRHTGWSDALQYLSVLTQVYNFGAGQLDPRFLALHISVSVFMLYLTVKILEARTGR